jgi:hypothetical protein
MGTGTAARKHEDYPLISNMETSARLDLFLESIVEVTADIGFASTATTRKPLAR